MTEPEDFAQTGTALITAAVLAVVRDGEWWTAAGMRERLFGPADGPSSQSSEHHIVLAVLWRMAHVDKVLEHEGNAYRLGTAGR